MRYNLGILGKITNKFDHEPEQVSQTLVLIEVYALFETVF
jgi:hypothetical protein